MSKFVQPSQCLQENILHSILLLEKRKALKSIICFHLKKLDKGKQNTSQIRGEINEIQSRNTIAKINKVKSFLCK